MNRYFLISLMLAGLAAGTDLQAQDKGRVEGRVALLRNGLPLHQATVMIVELNLVTETDDEGRFVFTGIEPGNYEVIAYTASLSADSQLIEISSGETIELEFRLVVSPLKQEITVTAKGREETAFEAVQSVDSLDSFDIAERMAPSLGDLLEGQTGVAKRSFGPGSARPVIRGFDGDRVLVMQDGVRAGALASQSGDHGEPLNPITLERVEIVKGPATLLYGSNAIGGVVNAVSGHHEIHQQAHQGVRGQVSSVVGTNGGQSGTSAIAEFGTGKWMIWVSGGGQRTGNYDSPLGEVDNSKTRMTNASAGLGWYGDKAFAALEYLFDDGRYGIPFASELHGHHEEEEAGAEGEKEELQAVDVDFQRHFYRFSGGFRNLGTFVDAFRLSLNFADWRHDEVEILEGDIQEIGTSFDNQQFIYRGVFEQARRGRLNGSFGFEGMARDYDVAGEEALSPPVDQNTLALFGLEELDFERLKIQLGARLEHTRYATKGTFSSRHAREGVEPGALPERDFTGVSAGIGARFELNPDTALVANLTSSHRAPALEELYNFGPHVGNLAFELGNPGLGGERSNGIDLSLRHLGSRWRGELNFFYYAIGGFVFLAPTGEIEDGLFEAEYAQGNSRFVGSEAELDVGLRKQIWLNFGVSAVDAVLTDLDSPLPRIPALKSRVGLDFRSGGLSVQPELVLSAPQDDLFPTELRTAGYGVVNLRASYTLPTQHAVHHFSVSVFNVGDKLYRNHLSFIKELAPEMGRGVRLSYALKFF